MCKKICKIPSCRSGEIRREAGDRLWNPKCEWFSSDFHGDLDPNLMSSMTSV